MPCQLCGVQFNLCLPNDNEIDFLVTGMAIQTAQPPPLSITESFDSIQFSMDLPESLDIKNSTSSCQSEQAPELTITKREKDRTRLKSPKHNLQISVEGIPLFPPLTQPQTVLVSILDYLPGHKIKKYIGRVCHHLIREPKENRENKDPTTNLPGKNKLGNLASVFLREAISVARAHVMGMGGDALIGFSIDTFDLVAATGSTGYCVISFSGDAVLIRKKRAEGDS